MKLSRKFVEDYIDLDKDLSITQIAEDMTSIGNEYDFAGKFVDCTNLVVGEVLKCVSHPDSDHLHVCEVDVGSEVLSIVCGAPNVREGLKVVVALDGAHLPGGEIKKGKIRGVESNGMLCSIAELGIESKFLSEEDKAGICELPLDTPVGEDALKVLGFDDEVVDFELTSNRGDLQSILGMAYELGALYHKKVKEMDISYQEIKNKNINDSFRVDVQTSNCSLFLAKRVENVEIHESPDFIKKRLMASGIRPINNVVDISNYVMLETGQPMHFYDADRLGDTLIVRMAKKGEELKTLDQVLRTLDEEDIVIANQKEAVGLAGVMGGLSTEVEVDTKNILIEAAIFDNVKIRKTSKKILRSEASMRFEKGLDPKRTYMAIERSCHLLEKYANAIVNTGMVEYHPVNTEEKKISLEYSKIERVLGISIPREEVHQILNDLGFEVHVNDTFLEVLVPSRRLDISIAEDLIEEIGRMHGIDKIPGKLPTLDARVGTYSKVYRDIKHKLADLGLNETCSYSLIPSNEVHQFTKDEFESILLESPMTSERDTLRYSLLYSLKEIYLYNKAHNQSDISIFEMGKGFYKENHEYKENMKVAAFISGNYYVDIPSKKADFYTMKGIVEELLDYLGFAGRYSFVKDDAIPNEFHPGQSASIVVQGKNIGIMGRIHPNSIKENAYAFEINLDELLSFHPSKMVYQDIAKYPSIEKDFAVIVDKSVESNELVKCIKKNGTKLLREVSIFDIYEGDKIADNKKSIAFNLSFLDQNRTLTEDEVMVIFNQIIDKVVGTFEAELRDK